MLKPLLAIFALTLSLWGMGCTGHLLPAATAPAVIRNEHLVIVTATEQDTLESLAGTYLGDPAEAWRIRVYNDVQEASAGRQLVIPLQSPFSGLRPNGYQTVPILFYPRIGPEKSSGRGFSVRTFEDQLRFLRKNGYETISLQRLGAFLNLRGSLPPKAILITFDTADRWVYDLAYPALQRYGMKAAVFIPTGQIGNPRRLKWEELSAMAAAGFEIGVCGVYGRPMRRGVGQAPEAYARSVEEEISRARSALAQHLKMEEIYFAHPGGSPEDLVIALLKKHGYRGAFTRRAGANPFFANDFKLRRTTIGHNAPAHLAEALATFHEVDLHGQPAASAAGTTDAAPVDYREKAAPMAARGDLPEALFAWRVAAALDPSDAESRDNIKAMEAAMDQAAAEHFKRGVAHFRDRARDNARNEFLTAVRLNPEHSQARFFLKKRLDHPEADEYTVQPGDSFTRIAAQQYRDAGKAGLIAYFNDLDPGKPLLVNTLLLLPQLEDRRLSSHQEPPPGAVPEAIQEAARQKIQAQGAEAKLRQARKKIKQGAYEEAILIGRQVLEENPEDPMARELLEAAHYALGRYHLDHGRELAAIDALKGLRPEYRDTAQLRAQAQGRLNSRSEEFYRAGVKHFLNEELEEAVAAWRKALEMNPQHPKARQDMENSLRLLDKWRDVDPGDKNGQSPAPRP